MHQSARPSVIVLIRFSPDAGTHCTSLMAARASSRKPTTDANHCIHTTKAAQILNGCRPGQQSPSWYQPWTLEEGCKPLHSHSWYQKWHLQTLVPQATAPTQLSATALGNHDMMDTTAVIQLIPTTTLANRIVVHTTALIQLIPWAALANSELLQNILVTHMTPGLHLQTLTAANSCTHTADRSSAPGSGLM